MLLSLIPRHPRRCEDAEKLKKLNSVVGPMRKLKGIFRMRLSSGFAESDAPFEQK